MTEEEVVHVEPTTEKGIWVPLTMDGTLLVDGLLASCYASFSHDLVDLALAPVKMFPRMLLDDEESVKVVVLGDSVVTISRDKGLIYTEVG